jgi:hypothetical protein
MGSSNVPFLLRSDPHPRASNKASCSQDPYIITQKKGPQSCDNGQIYITFLCSNLLAAFGLAMGCKATSKDRIQSMYRQTDKTSDPDSYILHDFYLWICIILKETPPLRKVQRLATWPNSPWAIFVKELHKRKSDQWHLNKREKHS